MLHPRKSTNDVDLVDPLRRYLRSEAKKVMVVCGRAFSEVERRAARRARGRVSAVHDLREPRRPRTVQRL